MCHFVSSISYVIVFLYFIYHCASPFHVSFRFFISYLIVFLYFISHCAYLFHI
eukprot:TRINITY_DN3536_c0_g1_i1.p2 TRINITY_DN3536_c0_g1~~TRINITY_DN3536_c0_g1_i1.p2  ORF type:complete len:53 (-),score=4.43 TRINITY_DN3536_c0_g1_i1:8-166(-)